ncbi:hypothetical protein RIF29_21378 [Crotalaria pallida]|uniref:DUF7812 domain-containing protein n=1 Tax=Crotalaria pallida TaxID=3830 RepID=A0AAN9I756_CROPI
MHDAKKLYQLLSNNNNNNNTSDPNLKDPSVLYESLFHQLHTTFQQFFSSLPPLLNNDKEYEPQSGSHPCPNSRLWSIVEDLSHILRCCLVVLTLPNINQQFLLLNCHFILTALKAFVSVQVTECHGGTFLRFRNFVSDVDMDLPDSSAPFLCAVLEVFADELLRHHSLRKYLMITDSTYSISEKLFSCRSNHVDTASVLEVISTHFIQSISTENAFENFIGRLFLNCGKDSRFPRLSLAPAIILLLDPIMLSAPKMLQAHLISLVSEVIGSGLSSENLAPDMNFYLTAFEKSVTLYSLHVSSLQMVGFNLELKPLNQSYLLETGQPTFFSCIQQVTSNRLNQVMSKSDNSWDSYQCKMSSRKKANRLTEFISFMKGRQYIFPDSCRDMAASFLDCLIHRTFSQDVAGDASCINENTSASDIFLLSSILKLMSISLIQAIKCLINSSDSGCLKTMGSTSVREKYDYLISIISHFQQFKFCLPIQTFLDDIMKSQQTNLSVSKSVLVHFSGLLSLCFSRGLDLLAQGCISVIMALMYLFNFEEGDLVALGSLRDPLQSCSSEIPSDKTREGAGDKQFIHKVAAEFQRVRTRKLRSNSVATEEEEETEETCNGEIFLDCILEGSRNLPDYDELADFLECKKEKDYSRWLKGRQIFRKRKYEKMMNLRKIKKKAVWNSMKTSKFFKRSNFEAMK